MCCHVAPWSSERDKPERPCSGVPITKTRWPLVCIAIATLIRPVYCGSVVTFVHVLPSSVDLYSAVPFGPCDAPPPPPPKPPPAPCDVAKITFGMSYAYSTSRVPFV